MEGEVGEGVENRSRSRVGVGVEAGARVGVGVGVGVGVAVGVYFICSSKCSAHANAMFVAVGR